MSYCIVLYRCATYLCFHRSEYPWPTWRIWLRQNCTADCMICALQPLEGVFANPSKPTDLRVTETLNRHGKCHFFEVLGYVTADHQDVEQRRTDKKRRGEAKTCSSTVCYTVP